MIDVWSPRFVSVFPLVESYFIRIFAPENTMAIWLKYTFIRSKKAGTRGKVWCILFDRRRNPQVVGRAVEIPLVAYVRPEKLTWIELGRNCFSYRHCTGRIDEEVSWDLQWNAFDKPLLALPTRGLYADRLPTTKLATVVPRALFTGQVKFADIEYSVSMLPGSVGHNWGRRHTKEYLWAYCTTQTELGDIALECFSAKPVSALPAMTGAAIRIGGDEFHLFSFQSQATFFSERDLRVRLTSPWNLRLKSRRVCLSATFRWEEPLVAGLRYENPDHSVGYCLNSMLGTCEFELVLAHKTRLIVNSVSCALEKMVPHAQHGYRVIA